MSRRRRHLHCHRRRRRVALRQRVRGGDVARVENTAAVGAMSGIVPINVQVPIQVGANAQKVDRSENVSTTTI